MLLLALLGGVLLCLAWALREYQLSRERSFFIKAIEQLNGANETLRQQARRLAEDQYVLERLLIERNVLEEAALARGRIRLVEAPRRQAEERAALLQNLNVAPVHLVADDETKVH